MTNQILNFYLAEEKRGSVEAGFLAGKLMENNGGYNEIAIQKQYEISAERGYLPAQRELASMGLYGKLITEDSTAYDITYYTDYDKAMMWLRRAARRGDTESQIILKAIEERGCSVIEVAKRAIELYKETTAKAIFNMSDRQMLMYEIVIQYIDPFEINKYSKETRLVG